MRFHVVGLPHTTTAKEHCACAYTAKVLKFCKMMMDRGHTVFHYGAEGSTVQCTKHFDIMTAREYKRFWGDFDYRDSYYPVKFDCRAPYFAICNNRAVEEIRANHEPKDFVCLIGGGAQQPIANGLAKTKTLAVEYGIGYFGTFAKYRVFESYSHMALVYGRNNSNVDGKWFDAVIPNYFDLADFTFQPKPTGDYYLFVGRMIPRKGLQVLVDLAKATGKTIKMCGQIDKKAVGGNRLTVGKTIYHAPTLEFVGHADTARRDDLMRNAKALIAPTIYLEPFGGVAVEAQLCGTPVITTDWGAFPETVEHGLSGYRCRTLEQFTWAMEATQSLDRGAISDRARRLYSLEKVGEMYEEYFSMLHTMWDKGWYEKRADRTELDWLKRI